MLSLSPLRHGNYAALSVTASACWPRPLTFWPLNRLTGYSTVGFLRANFGLPWPFRSRVRSRHATDRQTDGWTDRQTPAVSGTSRHNKVTSPDLLKLAQQTWKTEFFKSDVILHRLQRLSHGLVRDICWWLLRDNKLIWVNVNSVFRDGHLQSASIQARDLRHSGPSLCCWITDLTRHTLTHTRWWRFIKHFFFVADSGDGDKNWGQRSTR